MENHEFEEKVKELERTIVERDESLTKANDSIGELRESHARLENELKTLGQAKTELETKLVTASDNLKQAVGCYRDAVLKSQPGVVAELVSGDSIASINESLEKTKSLVGRVKQTLETEASANRVPMGSPARSPADLSHLSPREKISLAVSGFST